MLWLKDRLEGNIMRRKKSKRGIIDEDIPRVSETKHGAR